MGSRRLLGLIALVVVAFAAAALLLPHSPAQLREEVVAAGVAAPAIAILAWIVLTPALFSGTVLAAASGLAFGTVGGVALSLVGAVLGGLAAFAIARTVARPQVERMVSGSARLSRLHGLLERRGFHAVLAARLMPGVPSTGLHYAAGVSPVSGRAFAGAIAIGAVLRTTPYAILGQGLGSGSIATLLVAVGSIALGGGAAALLFRRMRQPAAAAA